MTLRSSVESIQHELVASNLLRRLACTQEREMLSVRLEKSRTNRKLVIPVVVSILVEITDGTRRKKTENKREKRREERVSFICIVTKYV